MRIGGTFNGTGAAVYICLGFVPDFFRLWNCEGSQALQLEWNKNMRTTEIQEGVELATSTFAANTVGAGIKRYYGGDLMTSTNQTSVTYGEGVYLRRDEISDYRRYTKSAQGIFGDAESVDIDTWTLYSGYTGHFNGDVVGTYIGEGSPICIDGKWYYITTLAAGYGSLTSAVTLDQTGVPSGTVTCIGGMFDFKPVPLGETTKAGVVISDTTVNVNDALCAFEAGIYDF
jgi:hypothetical protein